MREVAVVPETVMSKANRVTAIRSELHQRPPFLFSLSISGKEGMKAKKASRVYNITLVYENNLTRDVKVRASSREVAEKRALKRNPNAIGIQQRA